MSSPFAPARLVPELLVTNLALAALEREKEIPYLSSHDYQ
jgi:hypothetical protein